MTHGMPDLVFKNVRLFNMNRANVCMFKANNQNKVWNMLTFNNKDTRTTLLTSLILNTINIDILNIEQLLHLILALKLLTLNRQFLAGTNDNTNKNSQKKIFSSI